MSLIILNSHKFQIIISVILLTIIYGSYFLNYPDIFDIFVSNKLDKEYVNKVNVE